MNSGNETGPTRPDGPNQPNGPDGSAPAVPAERLALLPSAGQLAQPPTLPDLPAELRNPLQALPHPVSLDTARQLARATPTPTPARSS